MIGVLLGLTLIVIAVPDPGTSASGATVVVAPQSSVAAATSANRREVTIGADGRAVFELPDDAYRVRIEKTGFVPAERNVPGRTGTVTVRLPLRAVLSAALRTIGAVGAAERGAFNRAPQPIAILPREGYRDQGQPGSASVLTQTPSIAVDRAGRGLAPAGDVPPIGLVRGGTPLETQVLLEGVPIALPTTRTIPLSAIPSFVVSELEVQPGQAAALPTIDGALNGTLNIRFAEPTPVWRALPELGGDSRNGSFADLTAGGALANRRIGVALAAVANGAKGQLDAFDTVQRALLLKTRAALSPATSLTATTYDEIDKNRLNANTFGFTEGELRMNGAHDFGLARWWHAGATRRGPLAGDPLETQSDDALTGGSVEFDHVLHDDQYALGVSETYGQGSALGAVRVDPGASVRVQTAFGRAIVHPLPRVETQVTVYGVHADLAANGHTMNEGGIAARLGIAFRPNPDTAVRGSIGAGFTPPSLIAFAGMNGRPGGPTHANGADLGFDRRVFDRETTLSFDVFSSTEQNRLITGRDATSTNVGTVARRGAELSLARRPRAGLGYLLLAWTASETPAIPATTFTDVASGATHGYAEISYHGVQGSRISLGATYWGADASLAQPAVVLLNSNLELQIGARGKLQLSLENLNDAARAVTSARFRFLETPSAFAPGPRTLRLLLRRSFGSTGTDG